MEVSEKEDLQESAHHIANSVGWLLTRLLGVIFLLDTVFVVFLTVALVLPSDYYAVSIVTLWILFTLEFAVTLIIVFQLVVPWGSTQFYIQSDKLIRYRGFMRRDEDIYDLHNLKAVTLRQGWFGRRLNYGDLELVIAASGYKEDLRLVGIFNPKKYERVIREYLKLPVQPNA